jgi:arginase
LIGVFAALHDHLGRVGLAFVDGHQDFYTGFSSPTGEAADMDLAILTGNGPSGLIDLARSSPLVWPDDVVMLGYRDAAVAREDGALDPLLAAPGIHLYDAQALQQKGPDAVGASMAAEFEATPGRFWLHLDLDVLDNRCLPAVDYPMPGGLSWDEVAALMRPLVASPALVGADVTIYNPTLDADARYAQRIVALLADLFAAT